MEHHYPSVRSFREWMKPDYPPPHALDLKLLTRTSFSIAACQTSVLRLKALSFYILSRQEKRKGSFLPSSPVNETGKIFPKNREPFSYHPSSSSSRQEGDGSFNTPVVSRSGEPCIDELRMLNRNRRRKREFPFTNETRKSKLIFMRKLHFQRD
ncbi:hypothetical protein NPIL_594691 [Nephila pilipes]|uniref:Uncharacterized protein n=1 Tax=Nephila pilipes TaxID=299642 RepID=A0A8X6QZ61_NEPPI|nr:hypothetical protein NPIL_594691 [Nephila pilipes]